jgi:hypothetical protein
MAEVNTFNDFSVAAREEYPLISNMSFLLKPQVGATLFDVNPLETDIGEMFKMGLMEEVMGEEIIHHEANKRFDAPYVNTNATQANVYGTASVGNGDPALYDGLDYVQLAAQSHSPQTGANALKYSYPRVGQLIQFKNKGVWRINGKRTAGYDGAHRLYIVKVDSSFPSLANTITNAAGVYGGDQFAVIGSAFEEATYGMQTGVVPTSKTFTNYLMTMSDYYDITDWQARNETYPLEWHGKVLNFVYPKGFSDTEVRFAFMESSALFLTPRGSAIPGFDKNNNAVTISTTQGYMPNLELNAPKLYYDNNPTLGLFEQIIRLRRKLHQGRECLMQCGYEFLLKAKDIITQFGVNGSVVYNRHAVDLNIDTIKIGGFVFNMKELMILNHPDVTALPGFNYPWYFIIAPMDKTKDAKTGIMRNAFTIMWKRQMGGGSRGHYKIWQTGADADVPTDDQAVKRIHLRTRKGTRVVAASKFILGQRLQSA